MPANRRHLLIEQGATWFDDMLLTQYEGGPPLDLTGMSLVMVICADADSAAVLLELSSANGRITTEPLLGIVRRRIAASDTALLNFDQAVYQIELHSAAEEVRIEQGNITLSRAIPRWPVV